MTQWKEFVSQGSDWFVQSWPLLIFALIALIVCFFFGKICKFSLRRFLPRFSENILVVELLAQIAFISFVFLGAFVALDILGFEKTLTTILASAGVLGLALSFAFQDIANNFISGVFIAFLQPFKVGQAVEVSGVSGVVKGIHLRDTHLETFTGLSVIIPNKEVFMGKVTNFSIYPRRRIDLTCGVSYSTDLAKMRDILLPELSKLPNQIEDRPVRIFFTEFSDSSIDFTVQIWVDTLIPNAFLETRHLAIIRIKQVFDQHQIDIPFPIRTLDVPDDVLRSS